MNREILIKKIQALLHDPPEKALILGKVNHEEMASNLMRIIEESASITNETKDADHIASASDRINFPKDIEAKADFSKEPVIVHPLSGKEFKIPPSATSAITGIDYKRVMDAVEEAIKEIAAKYDLESGYLSLWAELYEIIREKESGKSALGQLWELLPADTRIPDHSIWEHRRVASAIAGALPEPSLLLFSIGPVQDFIATARKTQDLWSGSYMLSYISWTAMKAISEEMGPDSIIFPDLMDQPFCNLWLIERGLKFIEKPYREPLSSPTLPNRALAILPKDNAEQIARRAEDAVRRVFAEICLAVKEEIENSLSELKNDTVWKEIWNRQTGDFLQVYWSILPIGKKSEYKGFIDTYKTFLGDDHLKYFEKLLKEYETKGFCPNIGTVYGQLYKFLEKAHGSRKTIRDFSQQSEPHYKCTICGMREPVHPEQHNNQNCEEHGALVRFWKERLRSEFQDIKPSERLCAVCLTKRFACRHYFNKKKGFGINTSYPSTSTMSTAAFKLRIIEKSDLNDLLIKAHSYTQRIHALVGDTAQGEALPMVWGACRGKKLCEAFAKLEGDWLYEESLDEKALYKEYGKGKSEEEFKQIFKGVKDAFYEFKEVLEEKERELKANFGSPSKYYAIIQMDGDNMGKWVSGENAPEIEKILHPAMREQLKDDANWRELLNQKRPLNPSLHIATSKALRDFSLKIVREIVERDHLGKLIYAGGDDVLAFVSLKDLPAVMRCLRAYFSGSLVYDEAGGVKIDFQHGSGFVPIDEKGNPLSLKTSKNPSGFLYSMGTSATASMGVSIVHHSYDLSKALQEARDTEKKAKGAYGRNAFCISLDKRSGGAETFGAKWYYENDGYFEGIPVLEKLVDAFDKGISPKFAYDFKAELFGLQALPVDEAVYCEVRRLAIRHKNKDFQKEKVEEISTDLLRLKKNGISLEEISSLLNIATFLARRENQ
ncbi:MAG: type III-B CRISPR-associated protein Cas10/Cmr2 [Candidatus Brocadia carolinensis]|uniref:Type III-B CRISPR-associated protein Cas10/Cmr2 n=1 Tax=Candidatus Brocadia carolinensis TaxID=1004156 RepID=A0A1V4AR86_9BACT|nr:MAG: type III-B CRISPR-associated protein Cas10/Cmr2 [Candidatus Brocadia caroliniensis]